ncbi:hypothetical protein [Rodentibacter ratti]|uniref:hypothetical protein n=1 Tax=Rodentibacter ratti TaxID=1906745 RepID=UPI0009857A6E|nr:hypothetical protein [Rodentibacter ratti]
MKKIDNDLNLSHLKTNTTLQKITHKELEVFSSSSTSARLSLSDRIRRTKLSKLPVIDEWDQLIPISKEI